MSRDPITRERFDELKAAQGKLLLRHRLLSEYHRRFPSPAKLKRLPADEVNAIHRALLTNLEVVLDALSFVMDANSDTIKGMDSLLERRIEWQGLLAILDTHEKSRGEQGKPVV